MGREDPLKLTKQAKEFIKSYKIVAETLGVSVHIDRINDHPSKDKIFEYKSMYHFGKPHSIIIYLLRIQDMRQLIESCIHELVHHIQFLRGMFPIVFKKNGSQIGAETHARKTTDRILRSIFKVHGRKMTKETRKEYSK